MRKLICHLQSLHCHHCDERDGDELFIKYKGRKIWPENKKFEAGRDNCVIAINLKIETANSSRIVLQLWDYDFISDDLLGEFSFDVEKEGQFLSDLRCHDTGDHRFSLSFSVYPIFNSNQPHKNSGTKWA